MQKEISEGVAQVSAIEQHNKAMVGRSTTAAPPTGTTPQKRKWSYIDKWEKTKNREVLLKEHRIRQASGSGSGSDISQPSEPVEREQTSEEAAIDRQEEDLEREAEDEEGEGAGEGQEQAKEDVSTLVPPPVSHSENLLAAIDIDAEMPASDSSTSSSSDSAASESEPHSLPPPIEVGLHPVQVKPRATMKRRESGIPMPAAMAMKVQPVRPTLQEKSTNIVPEGRTRGAAPARSLRTRR